MSDRDELLVSLNSGRSELLAAVEGITDEQAAAKPVGACARWNTRRSAQYRPTSLS